MSDRAELVIALGTKAKAILDDETLTEAFDYIAERLTRDWRATSSNMSQHREALFQQLAGLDSLRGQLKRWAEDATYELSKIQKEEQRRSRRAS